MPDQIPGAIYWDQDIKYQWQTHGENCRFCDIMAGRVYSLDVMITSGVYPGFHPGCDCTLVQVAADVPMSDLDIFGSSLNMRNEGWLEAFFGHWDRLWLPDNITQPAELLSFAKPGMTAREAMILLNENKKQGIFNNYYGELGGAMNDWNIFRTVAPNLYKTFNQSITSWVGTWPKPPPLKPLLPMQTYHDPFYSLGAHQ